MLTARLPTIRVLVSTTRMGGIPTPQVYLRPGYLPPGIPIPLGIHTPRITTPAPRYLHPTPRRDLLPEIPTPEGTWYQRYLTPPPREQIDIHLWWKITFPQQHWVIYLKYEENLPLLGFGQHSWLTDKEFIIALRVETNTVRLVQSFDIFNTCWILISSSGRNQKVSV